VALRKSVLTCAGYRLSHSVVDAKWPDACAHWTVFASNFSVYFLSALFQHKEMWKAEKDDAGATLLRQV
jgi:catalase (peroxidase I)